MAYRIFYNLYLSPLNRFPGPRLNAATSLPFDIASVRGNAHHELKSLHEKYGPIVRVRPNELSNIQGGVWKDAYGHRSGHPEWPKGDSVTYANGVKGITSSELDDHRRFRRSLHYAFSKSGLRDQEPRIQHYINLLLRYLTQKCDSDPIDIMAWFSWTTTDIIGDLAFGDNFQCLEKQVENFWMASILKVMRPALWIGILQRWGLGAFALVLLPRKIIHGLLENDHFVGEKLRKRVVLGKDRGDFLDYVLKHDLVNTESKHWYKAESSKGGEEDMGFTFEELKSITSDILTAGSESMATVLTGIVFNLIRNPMVYAKVTGEIRCKFARDEDICFKTTSPPALPYLTGVIKESIRHYTAAPLFSGRVVPNYADGGDTFDGYRLPAGTRVTAAPVVAFQSSYNFSRPDSFVPERWFPVGNGRPEEFDNDNHDAFLPVCYGVIISIFGQNKTSNKISSPTVRGIA